jgi:hypothetical protein
LKIEVEEFQNFNQRNAFENRSSGTPEKLSLVGLVLRTSRRKWKIDNRGFLLRKNGGDGEI